jgi:hypothetical protein
MIVYDLDIIGVSLIPMADIFDFRNPQLDDGETECYFARLLADRNHVP